MFLNMGQVISRSWDIPVYPQDILGCSWDYLGPGKVIDRVKDILGYPRIFNQYSTCSKVFVPTVREDLGLSGG